MAHCPSSIVRTCVRMTMRQQFFKQPLLLNQLAKFVETMQGRSLYETLPTLFKELNSMKNSGCHGNRIDFFKILKHVLIKKTTRPTALVFDMHNVVVLYKDCSNYAPRVKSGPARRLISFI